MIHDCIEFKNYQYIRINHSHFIDNSEVIDFCKNYSLKFYESSLTLSDGITTIICLDGDFLLKDSDGKIKRVISESFLDDTKYKDVQNYKYRLTKCSDDSLDISSSDISLIRFILEYKICDLCKDYELDESYDSLSCRDKIDMLMSTVCGLEYTLEEKDD